MFFEGDILAYCEITKYKNGNTSYSSNGSFDNIDRDLEQLLFIQKNMNRTDILRTGIGSGDVSSSSPFIYKFLAKLTTNEHPSVFKDCIVLSNNSNPGTLIILKSPSKRVKKISTLLFDNVLVQDDRFPRYLKPSFIDKLKYKKDVKRIEQKLY